MTSRPVQIVVTPGSGAGLALVTARRLRRHLVRGGRETDIRSFDTLGALTRWAETCEPEFSQLVCIGGDATLSAAARAAIRHGVPFVPVPTGFGNVFAGVFGHPKEARDVAVLQGASNRLINVEDLTEHEVATLHRHYQTLAQIAKRDTTLTASHSVEEAETRAARKRA